MPVGRPGRSHCLDGRAPAGLEHVAALTEDAALDAAAFVITAFVVLIVNAVAAVAIGCACYLVRYIWIRLYPSTAIETGGSVWRYEKQSATRLIRIALVGARCSRKTGPVCSSARTGRRERPKRRSLSSMWRMPICCSPIWSWQGGNQKEPSR